MSVSVSKRAEQSSRIGSQTRSNNQTVEARHPPRPIRIATRSSVLHPFPKGNFRKSPPVPDRYHGSLSSRPFVDLEQFGRVCEHFLSNDNRLKGEPRPGTFIFNWAVERTQGSVGAGLFLSMLVYRNQTSPNTGKHRLRPLFDKGLSDADLNPDADKHLRRPLLVGYADVFQRIGLSERQVIDAVNLLLDRRLIEKHKVAGCRGPAIVLSHGLHRDLVLQGKLDGNYRPDHSDGEWRTWINASEIIALPRLTQALVLARWLRWMEWQGKGKRPENTHAQIAQQTGLSERTVALAMKQLQVAELLRPDYVKRKIPSRKLMRIPSPIQDAKAREQLTRLTVEQLAKRYRLPLETDLSVFWRDDEDHAANNHADKAGKIATLEHYEIATPMGPPVRPEVKHRRRRKISRQVARPAFSSVD